jgi:hypothetical protein
MVKRIAWLLAIAGSIPFAMATFALFVGDSHIRVPAITALVTVSAILLSYLGGVEGGLALREEGSNEGARAIAIAVSILPSLAAWGVLWLPSPQWQVGASLALFVAVWANDLWLARQGLIPSWFVDLRTGLSALVVLILGVALWKLSA